MENKANPQPEKKTTTPEPSKREEKKRGGMLFIILAGLFLLIAGVVGYMWWDTKTQLEQMTTRNTELTEEVATLEADIEGKIAELQALKGENAELDARIQEKIDELEQMKKDLSVAQNKAAEVDKLRGKLWLADKKYVALKEERDSLVTANAQLTTEKQAALRSLSEKEGEVQELASRTEILTKEVAKGKMLSAFSLTAEGVKVKSSGKEKETDKANRANNIRACFTLSENRIAEPGKKEVYMIVKNPTGVTLARGESTSFSTQDGEEKLYTAVEEISYNNEALPLCMYWESKSQDGFAPGKYEIEIWADGGMIGSSTIILE